MHVFYTLNNKYVIGCEEDYHNNAIEGECNQLEDQLLRFPRSKHDDVSDSLAYGNDIVKIPKFEEPINNRGFYEMEEDTPFNSIGL